MAGTDAPVAAASAYRILDEPRPGPLAQIAVNPMWPLLTLMLGSYVVGIAWFVVNGLALGSPTRVREMATAAGGLAGATALTFALLAADHLGWLGPVSGKFAILPLVIFKLAIGYLLFDWQNRTVHLYQYFGGVVRNGVMVMVAAMLLRKKIILAFPTLLWQLTVS